MTVLDAFAVVALMREEQAAGAVAEIVRSPTVLTSVDAAEVLDRLVRRYDRDADDVEMDLRLLGIAGMEMVPKDAAVSLADCVAAATALHLHRPIATADPALAAVVRAEGGTVTALPDSRGQMP